MGLISYFVLIPTVSFFSIFFPLSKMKCLFLVCCFAIAVFAAPGSEPPDRRCIKPCLGNLRHLDVFICTARYKGRKLALKHLGKCKLWEIQNPKQLPLLFHGQQQQLLQQQQRLLQLRQQQQQQQLLQLQQQQLLQQQQQQQQQQQNNNNYFRQG